MESSEREMGAIEEEEEEVGGKLRNSPPRSTFQKGNGRGEATVR